MQKEPQLQLNGIYQVLLLNVVKNSIIVLFILFFLIPFLTITLSEIVGVWITEDPLYIVYKVYHYLPSA